MNRKTTVLLVVIFAVLIAAAVYAYTALRGTVTPESNLSSPSGQIPDSAPSATTPRQKAPDFTVVDADGKQAKLSDMLGKPVVLNFWASWCSPCKSEMPEFNEVYKELGGEVQFMMVNMTDGQRETVASGSKYVSDQQFSFPVYFDTEQNAAYTYGIRSIPTTIFIDKDGYIVSAAQGSIDENALRKGIDMTER